MFILTRGWAYIADDGPYLSLPQVKWRTERMLLVYGYRKPKELMDEPEATSLSLYPSSGLLELTMILHIIQLILEK